ncbi:MAG: hypothetical protein AAF743_08715, partial [Planctomycetota bacterium]
MIEKLEARRLLTTLSWDGGGDGVNWTDPLNWSEDRLPEASDDVVIDVPGDPLVRMEGVTGRIGSLTVRERFEYVENDFYTSGPAVFEAPVTFVSGKLGFSVSIVECCNPLVPITFEDEVTWLGGSMGLDSHSVDFEGQLNLTGGEVLLQHGRLHGSALITSGYLIGDARLIVEPGAHVTLDADAGQTVRGGAVRMRGTAVKIGDGLADLSEWSLDARLVEDPTAIRVEQGSILTNSRPTGTYRDNERARIELHNDAAWYAGSLDPQAQLLDAGSLDVAIHGPDADAVAMRGFSRTSYGSNTHKGHVWLYDGATATLASNVSYPGAYARMHGHWYIDADSTLFIDGEARASEASSMTFGSRLDQP